VTTQHPRRFTRRALLRAAAGAPLSLAIASALSCSKKAAGAGKAIVVGGGLAGLVALDRLVKAGKDAILLEAGTRLGGRIYTVRDRPASSSLGAGPLAPGLRAEMGAERVAREHGGVRALLGELGIPTAPYPQPSQMLLLEWKGKSYRSRDFKDLPADVLAGLSDRERAGAPLAILQSLIADGSAPAKDDARSGIEWLRSIGMTPKGEELVRAFVALPLDGMPAPVLYRAAIRDLKAQLSDTVAGGTDRIVNALAARHSSRITTGVPVASVGQDENGVVVRDAGGRAFEGAVAVVCLPLAPLRNLAFDGGAPEPLAARLRVLEIAHEMKFATELHRGRSDWRPDWPEYAFSPGWVSWRLPEVSADGGFIQQSLAWEPDPRAFEKLTGPAGSFTHDFATDPLIGGAYAYARSGFDAPGIVRAGRLVFAGADLSEDSGWMEGAVRSAEQAVAAVISG
jgi:monoamine oxidase